MNSKSVGLGNNLFFCIVGSKGKLLDYFFWIGVPIMGDEKYRIIRMIKEFFEVFLKDKSMFEEFQ